MKNIPINKGNFASFETKERIDNFEKYRAEGWEAEYKAYRNRWMEGPKTLEVPEYPVQVDIEVSNGCNLSCPMCFRGKAEFKEKYKNQDLLMSETLFKKVIDEIGGKVPAIRLSLRGESTLHPKLAEFAKYAKDSGIGEVSFLTNGSKLTESYFETLVKAGVDWITISVDGVDETYESIRKPLKFKDTLNRIEGIQDVKKRLGVHKPVIKIQSVWPAIKANPERFYNTLAPFVDLVAFNPLIDYLANDEEDQILYIDNFTCPQHYQRLIIGFDGKALMCTNDDENTVDIGNANEMTIYEIWHGEKLQEIRDIHLGLDGFKTIPVCKACFLPRKTEPNETAVVNDRTFLVHNYINRSQKIGE